MRWQAISEAWGGMKARVRLRDIGKRQRIDIVKWKIRSHVERGQGQSSGAAVFSYNAVVKIVDADERVYLQEALDELVAGGILDRVFGGFYALKGRGPTERMYP